VSRPGSPDAAEAGRYQAPAGLLEKLMAAVRPEFRAGVLTFDPRDPVFGGPPCAVPGCERPARSRNLCWGHRQRWHQAGKPDLAAFTAATSPEWSGHLPLPACQVPGCNYCQAGRGLCQMHHQQWRRAGRPGISAWRLALDYAPPSPPPDACLVSYCDRWPMQTPAFCRTRRKSWRLAGRPEAGEFAAARADPGPGCEWIDVRCLPGRLRLEIQYVLQCRGDERQAPLRPVRVQRILRDLAATGAASLLERPEEEWAEFGPRGTKAGGGRQFVLDARTRIEQLAFGSGWETEYPRARWRLRNLGIQAGKTATIDFAPIRQPWLADLAKRWCRWRLPAGLSASDAAHGIRAIRRFSAFLADHSPAGDPASIDRPLLERYLAGLSASSPGPGTRLQHISALNGFFRDTRRHGWDSGALPAAAVFYPGDYPKLSQRLPRAVAGHVMAQVEDPANLDRWASPACRLLTVILIRCGLRISSAVSLPWDCTVTDADGAPCLRYYNTKMKREALVPIDDELRAMIGAQHDRIRLRWPDGTPVLFPRPGSNIGGTRPVGGGTYREALYRWLEDCDIRDEHGQPVHLTPHQWRHTLGTVLINRDVPRHVVQKILDHDSPQMTAHYARLSEKTVREHWEKARKVNAAGQPVKISPGGPLGDAARAKQQLSRATQALPNGYCQLPLVRTCPHANSCLTCPMFLTTAEFLPQHRGQRRETLQIISAAEAAGHTRVAEMNRQVAGNLDKIITALEADDRDGHKEAAASGS
jgi:integrase